MTNAALLATKLWPSFRKLLIRIGRWVLRQVRRHGAQDMAVYMRMRALGKFKERLERAVKRGWKRRARWLRGRIRRWLAMSAWLKRNAEKTNKRVVDRLDKLAIGDRIPKTSPWERRDAA